MGTWMMAALLLGGLLWGIDSYESDQDEEANAGGADDTDGGTGPATGTDPAGDGTVPDIYDLPQLDNTPLDLAQFENPDGITSGGTSGADQIAGSPDNDVLAGNAGDDVIDGFGGADGLLGEAGEDTLRGGFGDDVLAGGLGNDQLEGGDGADYLYGEAGDDLLRGDDGDDWLYGNEGSDTVIGGDGNDVLAGIEDLLAADLNFSDQAQAPDTLDAGAGNDAVLVGRGDIATLGSGNDVVVSGDWISGDDVPVVTDFNPNEDFVELDYRGGLVPAVSTFEQNGDTFIQMDSVTVLVLQDVVDLPPAAILVLPAQAIT